MDNEENFVNVDGYDDNNYLKVEDNSHQFSLIGKRKKKDEGIKNDFYKF